MKYLLNDDEIKFLKGMLDNDTYHDCQGLSGVSCTTTCSKLFTKCAQSKLSGDHNMRCPDHIYTNRALKARVSYILNRIYKEK